MVKSLCLYYGLPDHNFARISMFITLPASYEQVGFLKTYEKISPAYFDFHNV